MNNYIAIKQITWKKWTDSQKGPIFQDNQEEIERINFQNIQAAHTAQYQKSKQPNQKVGKRPKQTFLQRRHTDG